MCSLNIVLHEPEIPANTGNIGRSCVAAGANLHLIRPLGFSTTEKHLRRAGMDYWQHLDVQYYDNFDDFVAKNNNPTIFMASSKVSTPYTKLTYPHGSFVMFGKESAGIPRAILDKYPNTCIRIPMTDKVRCLNLASSVAIVLYEAMRQQGFVGLG